MRLCAVGLENQEVFHISLLIRITRAAILMFFGMDLCTLNQYLWIFTVLVQLNVQPFFSLSARGWDAGLGWEYVFWCVGSLHSLNESF